MDPQLLISKFLYMLRPEMTIFYINNVQQLGPALQMDAWVIIIP